MIEIQIIAKAILEFTTFENAAVRVFRGSHTFYS